MDFVLVSCIVALAGASGLSVGIAIALLLGRSADRSH